MRLTVVTNIPTPYRAPLYDELHRRLSERGGGLTVVYGARSERRSQWAEGETPVGVAPSIFLNRRPLGFGRRSTYANPLVVRALRRSRPDVAVLGGYAPWLYAAALWCRAAGVPYLVWSAETVHSAGGPGARAARRRPLWQGAAGYLAYGPAAAEYLRSARLDADAIEVVGNGIDVDGFANRAEAARARRKEIREELGLGGRVILSVGGKNLGAVLAAVEEMAEPTQVAVVGGRATEPGHPALVDLGVRPSADMPGVYVAADCVAHPAAVDLWPHAINEALAAGVPVVASPFTGVPDSVLAGPGCAVVEPEPSALAAAFERALHLAPSGTAELREEIRRPLRPYGVDRMAERILAAAGRASA